MQQPLSSATAEMVWHELPRHIVGGRLERVASQAACGRVLGEDVALPFDFPPFDRAAMDGFAVRVEDCPGPETTLPSMGLVKAGEPIARVLQSGCCARINTGAPVPDGADAIVMVEDSTDLPDGRVLLRGAPRPGQHIERQGAVGRAGDRLLSRGQRLDAGAVAALAAAGAERVNVFRRPVVGVLATGDELVDAGAQRRGAELFDSNSAGLLAMLGYGWSIGRAPDELAGLTSRLSRGAAECDLLCITGGMSRGTHDLVPQALESLGVRWIVSGLNMKPGKPTRIGLAPSGAFVLGLPGNPVSCLVCFALFGRMILDGREGLAPAPPPRLRCRLRDSMPANGSRPMFQPACWCVDDDGAACVRPLAWRGSGDPFGLASANALIHRPAGAPPASAGDEVHVVLLSVPR
ncbi:MAG: Molybdopterin molybdenumtransferase [Phycisphaerae bacterium]|nr:Molybdopterin molybdenumtransferase [Phycisphaerae bacterium]